MKRERKGRKRKLDGAVLPDSRVKTARYGIDPDSASDSASCASSIDHSEVTVVRVGTVENSIFISMVVLRLHARRLEYMYVRETEKAR